MKKQLIFLSEEFLAKYDDYPEQMNELAKFIFQRTYSRWLREERRRETYKEAMARAVDYNISIGFKERNKSKYDNYVESFDSSTAEAEHLFDNIFNQRQFLSGRTHWIGGADTKVADLFPLANFNCAFSEPKSVSDLSEIFYLLLVGTGVGIRLTRDVVYQFPHIRNDFELTHSEFKPLPKEERIEHTNVRLLENGYAKIYVGDSKEGWVKALEEFFKLITLKQYSYVKHIKISYNSIRPKGDRLETFGGTASGHEPLKEMFSKFKMVFDNEIDPRLAPLEKDKDGYLILRPIHLLDINCLKGANVVVGGVRRTALMIMFDKDDLEVMNAKKEFWMNPNLSHRAMSNNSIVFKEEPTIDEIKHLVELIKENGEPGWYNEESAKKRRPNARGVNPCGEILLDNKGVCNLTTVNVKAFVIRDKDTGIIRLNMGGLATAMRLSVRAGIRMTCLNLELPDWNRVHQRDRLIGASVTGWKDAMDILQYSTEEESKMLIFLEQVASAEASSYARMLRIPEPLLVTTVKPEGTLSQLANGVSSGLHYSYAPYYIRRVRINASDPLVQVAKELKWTINPEVATPGETMEERLANATTLVIDFPIESGATKTSRDVTLQEQFENYLIFQTHYTAHNSSITIYVKEDEWDSLPQLLKDNWNDLIGVSFLPADNGTYELAPYEEITKEQYEALSASMSKFDIKLLEKYEVFESDKDVVNIQSCDKGSCPVF